MNREEIFEKKLPFTLKYSIESIYTYQENQDKGEFLDHSGNVVAQLYEANPDANHFVIAGMFMGEVIYRSIFYKRCMNPEQGLRNILDFKN